MKKKTMITAAMSVLLIAGCSAPAASTPEPSAPAHEDIYIFYTSETHCSVDENLGFPALKALVDDTKAEHPAVLVDCGDFLQGGTLGSISRGSIIINLMNRMGYDVATFGNHEFDYGMDRTKELVGQAQFDMVAANARYTGSGTSVFDGLPAYVIKELGGAKVAFIGVLTPATLTSSTPTFFMEDGEIVYDFCGGDDGYKLASQVQATVNDARAEGADYVIALTHLGSIPAYSPYDAISLIHKTTGIDAVIDGHSHSVIIGDTYPNAEGEDVLLTSVGTKMENAGELIITADGTIESVLISEYDRKDADMEAAVTAAMDELNAILAEPLGTAPFDLVITDENGIRIARSRETNLGNYCADAVRAAMNTDVAILNGGALRHSLDAGEVTYGTLLNIFPFQNLLASCRCSGQQIIDVLEYGARKTEGITSFDGNAVGEYGGFLVVSGLKYTIDTSIASPAVVNDEGMLTGFEGPRRVSEVMILQDGEYVPIDPEGEYTISSTDYVLFDRGDGNTVFSDNEPLVRYGPVDLDALIEWFKATGTIDERYRTTEGRITVK